MLTAVVLMEGGSEDDLETLEKLAEKEVDEEEGEENSKGTLAGLIDTPKAAKSPNAATPKSPPLGKKVYLKNYFALRVL